jgi:hypothetical protein
MTAPDGTYTMPMMGEQIYQSLIAFDNNIRNSGVQMCHFTVTPCPVGRISKFDTLNKPHPDHAGCQNGHIYTFAGKVTVLFTGNTKRPNYAEGETINGSTAQASIPRFYDDNPTCPVIVSPWDRFTFHEPPFQVVHWELIDSNEQGNDRLKFPAVEIQQLIDNRGIGYQPCQDFVIDGNGDIQWLTNNRPGTDPDTGKGRLYSVRYLYNPFYYCSGLGHEVRVLPAITPDGKRQMMQAPRQITLERENTFRMGEHDDETQSTAKDAKIRQFRAPSSGGFSPK